MDDAFRDLLTFVAAHAALIIFAGVGAIGLAFVIAIARRFYLVRQERLWLRRRLSVPKRTNQPRARPHLPTKRERRRFQRRAGNPVSVEMYDEQDVQKIAEGRVVDRSMGVVCIASTTRFSVGSVFQIRPMAQRREMPSVPIEVRNARPDPANWRLGCRFLRRPSWSVLMYLR